MKDRICDKRHVRSKTRSRCLVILYHIRGYVSKLNGHDSRSDGDHPASDQSMLPTVTLTESDIPGAILTEPMDRHTMPELRWWLYCRGVTCTHLGKRIVCSQSK